MVSDNKPNQINTGGYVRNFHEICLTYFDQSQKIPKQSILDKQELLTGSHQIYSTTKPFEDIRAYDYISKPVLTKNRRDQSMCVHHSATASASTSPRLEQTKLYRRNYIMIARKVYTRIRHSIEWRR